MEILPKWLASLSEEDIQFLKRFVLASGSLKALAKEYGISYPTVRIRLDRLIRKIQASEDPNLKDEFHRELQIMLADGAVSIESAKRLLKAHRETLADASELEKEDE